MSVLLFLCLNKLDSEVPEFMQEMQNISQPAPACETKNKGAAKKDCEKQTKAVEDPELSESQKLKQVEKES